MDKILNGLTIHESPIKIRRHSKRVQAAELAQLVEHATENRSVRGPIPRLGTGTYRKAFLPPNMVAKEVFCYVKTNGRACDSANGRHVKIMRLPLSPEKTRLLALRVIRNQPLTYKALTPGIMSRVELLKVREELAKRELISKGVKGEIIPTPPLHRGSRNTPQNYPAPSPNIFT